MSVAPPLDLEPFWESKYGPTPPLPIWEAIFELVARESRVYLIPMRCVCRAWSEILKLAPPRFMDPMTRLFEVSARDGLTSLCIWAHAKGGIMSDDTLMDMFRTAAKTDNVSMIKLAIELIGGKGSILRRILYQFIEIAAGHGSLGVLDQFEGVSESYDIFWNIVFVSAAAGGQDVVYDSAKLHLSRLGVSLDSKILFGTRNRSIINMALSRTLGRIDLKPEMVARLIADGADVDAVVHRANVLKDPALGRLVIGHEVPDETVITDRIVAGWERIAARAEQARIVAARVHVPQRIVAAREHVPNMSLICADLKKRRRETSLLSRDEARLLFFSES